MKTTPKLHKVYQVSAKAFFFFFGKHPQLRKYTTDNPMHIYLIHVSNCVMVFITVFP